MTKMKRRVNGCGHHMNKYLMVDSDRVQDTKTLPKCCVCRNGKPNQQNYIYKCVDRSRHNGIKGAKAKCAH